MELRICGGKSRVSVAKRRSRALSVSGRGDGMFGILISQFKEQGTGSDHGNGRFIHQSMYLASPKPSA